MKEDPSRTFLCVRGFSDGYGYVREDSIIPKEGEIGVVYLDHGNHRCTNSDLCRILTSLMNNPPSETFTIRAEHIQIGHGRLQRPPRRYGFRGLPRHRERHVGVHPADGFTRIQI